MLRKMSTNRYRVFQKKVISELLDFALLMGACTKYADNERCVSGRITEGIQASTHNANKVQKVPFLGHCVKSLF